jgi:TolB-like protein/Tfp pilus assembly protein PilF
VLYQMITGQLPFVGKTLSDVIASVLTTEPPLLTTHVPEVPGDLKRIVAKALHKDMNERYQTVNELEADLKTLKHRLEFEAELERIGEGRGGLSEAFTKPMAKAVSTNEASAPLTELTQVHSTSSAEYLVGEIKRHKRGAVFALSVIFALIIAGSIFAYTRYFGRASKVGITSLAVLPFANASNDPEKEYLSDGFSESLVNRLSQLPGVKVISNTSSSRYKGNNIDTLEVARALGVSVLLTGRILQRGENLSISAELINGNDRTQLWGRQYTRKSSDLLSVQAEISKEIAENLRVRLTAGQQQSLVKTEKVNPEAYELLLKGRFFRSRGTTEDRKKAGEYFNQAIAVDPTYAPAYADLSDIYRSLVAGSVLNADEFLPKAKAASQKALELDSNLADAHFTLANLKTYDWEWDEAEREYKRAIELDPNLALAHRWFASYLRLRGRHDEAITEINRARELDPLSPGVNATVGYLLLNARQYDRAIESLKKTLEMDQQYPYAHLFLGFCYSAKEMYPEAIAAYEEAINLGLNTPSTKIYLAATYARAGNRQRAQTILEELQRTKDRLSPGEVAILYTAMGEREQAFASLEKAFKVHDLQLQYLGVSYWFDPLRSDPRFQDLMHRVGLAD